MSLIKGKYLKHELCGFSGDNNSMWIVVYDGRYNYMLFNACANRVLRRFKRNRLPSNDIHNGHKDIEFYSTYDTAVTHLLTTVGGVH